MTTTMATPLTEEQLEKKRKAAAHARTVRAKKLAAAKAAAARIERRKLESELREARTWADRICEQYFSITDYTTLKAEVKCYAALYALRRVRDIEHQLRGA